MGRYIDWGDVVGRYPDAARIGDASAVGSYHLAFAEDEIDARMSALGYTVPFSSAPGIIRDITIDMVYWRLTQRQKGAEVVKEYIDSRIKDIIDGTIALTVGGVSIEADSVAWSEQNKAGYHTVFGPDDPENWTPSTDQIEDVEATRD